MRRPRQLGFVDTLTTPRYEAPSIRKLPLLTVRDVFDHLAVVMLCKGLFRSTAHATACVLKVARAVPSEGDTDLDRIRATAASAGVTRSHDDALEAIEDIVRARRSGGHLATA